MDLDLALMDDAIFDAPQSTIPTIVSSSKDNPFACQPADTLIYTPSAPSAKVHSSSTTTSSATVTNASSLLPPSIPTKSITTKTNGTTSRTQPSSPLTLPSHTLQASLADTEINHDSLPLHTETSPNMVNSSAIPAASKPSR